MRSSCCVAPLALLIVATTASAATETGPVDVVDVSCVPTRVLRPGQAAGSELPAGPGLAVVDTHLRPRRARLYLDGRLVGVANDFDGWPGYLYLRPGRYRLEARLGGYRGARVEIEADAGCRYDLRHRLARLEGVRRERRWRRPPGIVPAQRVFGPLDEEGARGGSPRRLAQAEPRPRGVDLSLRPDLRLGRRQAGAEKGVGSGATLRLSVEPPSASVYLDGAFLASATELASMVNPLAVAPGQHLLEVLAPGFEPASSRFEVGESEQRVVDVRLEPSPLAAGGQADAGEE